MRQRLTFLPAIVALSAVSCLSAVLAAPASAVSPARDQAFDVRPIAWTTCDDADLAERGLECGTLRVPLDHARPNGPTIELALSRLPHQVAEKDYQGVVITGPGGPGGTGLGLATVGYAVPRDVGAAYDWIGFDPRGVGQSEPAVSCDVSYPVGDRPAYRPSTSGILRAWVSRARQYSADCARRNGPILRHMTTRDTALDVDLIRRALGQRTVSLFGFSYGTYIAQVYSTLFPHRVRRMILDGTVDPRGIWYRDGLEQIVPFERNARRFFDWVADHSDAYGLGTTGRVARHRYDAAVAELDRHPRRIGGRSLTGTDLSDVMLWVAYYEAYWPDLATILSRVVNDDDISALDDYLVGTGATTSDNQYAAFLATECTDAPAPRRLVTTLIDGARYDRVAPFFAWGNLWYNEPCRSWSVKPEHPVRIDGRKVASVLITGESLDAPTPIRGALEVRRRYPGARLVETVGGGTHVNALYGNACVDDRIADYLETGALPKRVRGQRADVTCDPIPLPEPAPAAKSSARAAAPTWSYGTPRDPRDRG